MRMLPRAFEVQHGIHDMLERLRAGDGAVFCNVADQENGHMIFLRPEQKLRSHLAHLADAAGRHFEFFTERGLNGVDDHHCRFHAFGRG